MIQILWAIFALFGEFHEPSAHKKPPCDVSCTVDTKECLEQRIDYRITNWEKCE